MPVNCAESTRTSFSVWPMNAEPSGASPSAGTTTGRTGQVERLRELEVSLVVRGHGHDRARAVVHQHVVGDPDRQPRVVDRVGRVEAGEHAGLRLGGGALLAALGGGDAHVVRGSRRRSASARPAPRPAGARAPARRTSSRTACRAGREHGHVDVQLLDPEQDVGALRAADPVALRGHHALRPVQLLEVKQLVGVRGRPEEPLLEISRLDDGAATLAASVLHLLVRQHGLILRAPLHGRGLAVGEAGLVQAQEQPLVPVDVLVLVRRDLAIPVDRPADPLHRLADGPDVALGDLARVPAFRDRGVLRRAGRTSRSPSGAAPRSRCGDRSARGRRPACRRACGPCAASRSGTAASPGRSASRGVGCPGLRVRDVEGPLVLPDLLPLPLDLVCVVRVHRRLFVSRDEKTSRIERPREAAAAHAALASCVSEEAPALTPTLARE